MQTIHPLDMKLRAQAMDFDILRVPLGLDVERLNTSLTQAKSQFPWIMKDGLPLYSSLGLQYHDAANPYGDAVQETTPEYRLDVVKEVRRFQFYTRFNDAADLFESIFHRLRPLRFDRSRLLMLRPGFESEKMHTDGRSAVRLHVPIETNPEARMYIQDKIYHLPADGSGYLLNTSLPHRIENAGKSNRTHFVGILYGISFPVMHDLGHDALERHIETMAWPDVVKIRREQQLAIEKANHVCEACHQKHEFLCALPVGSRGLVAFCAVCIDNAGRLSTSQSHILDEQRVKFDHELQRELER